MFHQFSSAILVYFIYFQMEKRFSERSWIAWKRKRKRAKEGRRIPLGKFFRFYFTRINSCSRLTGII